MEIKINKDERIDDLEFKGLKIIQNNNAFCFGIDSVLLSDFAKEIKKDSEVIDLGTGNAILPILLSGKTKLKKIYGVEIQEEIAKMAKKSVALNNLNDKIEILNCNIKELEKILDKSKFDYIVTNPPYKKLNSGVVNENEKKLIARHEIEASLEDFIKVSFNMLKDKGTLYMVHRPERMVDILSLLRKNKIEPKKIRMVYSNVKTKPCLMLIKAVKNAKEFLEFENNLYIYDEKGNYTEEILKIYNKK